MLNLKTCVTLLQIVLLEASKRLGGWVESTQYADGTVFEHGPRSIRIGGKEAINGLQLVSIKFHIATKKFI